MVVQACLKPNMLDEMDDDDSPLIFKRSSSTSKQKQLNSEANTTPQRKDGSSGKQVSGSVTAQNSDPQKGNTVPSAKTSHVKSPLSNSSASPSSSKASPVKSPLSISKKLSSLAEQSKHLSKEKMIVSKGEKISSKDHAKSNNYSEDSEDGKPLGSRLLKEKIIFKELKISYKDNVKPNSYSEVSDEERPISYRLSKGKMHVHKEEKSSRKDNAKPNNYSQDSEQERPLSPRLSKEKMLVSKELKNSSKDNVKPNNYSEDSEDERPLSYRLSKKKMIVSKEEKNSIKDAAEPNNYSEESEDERPLSYRLSTVSSKGILNHANQGVRSSTPVSSSPRTSKIIVKKSSGDPDEERPLSSRFLRISGVKPYDSETKPLSEHKLNGSMSRDDQRKSPTLSNKRPLDKDNSSSQSSVKKPKLLDASLPINTKAPSKKSESEDDEEFIPLAQRTNNLNTSDSKSSLGKQKVSKIVSSIKKTTFKTKKIETNSKYSKSIKMSPSSGEGKKWTTLVHNGVIFPPPYKSHGVKMLYKGKHVDLTSEQEEVATMFAVMLETDYARKEVFLTNFMNDWTKILGKKHVIQKFEDCDFTPIYEWHQKEKEKKKLIDSEEKKALKEEKINQEEKYMWATVDGTKEKVGNFRVEPPGLFRGRGEHPKMGKLKRRICPSDITINIGKNTPIPECPIVGERWKEVKHDNTVTWLAFWNDPINSKEFKYVFLAASSSLKGQSDKEKYEKARTLKEYIQGIRASYTKGFVSTDITTRQIAVATYLIDKLALRAGNEKDDDEADTVGCCTLKVENVKLISPNKLEFDFLGKDSIRYNNVVEVELPVYKAIGKFQKGKSGGDDLFDKLDTSKLNCHLKGLMPGLTAKVFRTYNASSTLDAMLTRDTKGGEVAEKIVVYNHANKEVAIICNHQRTVSKSHASQISKLNEKINELKGLMDELQTDLARANKGKALLKDKDGNQKKNMTPEVLERKMAQTNAKIEKMERDKYTK